ncbi:uncharacterized protein ACDP82_021255 [Pangshura tecta]
MGRGIIQEQQTEEKLAEVDLSRLEILFSRDQQSSAFCLPHNCLLQRNHPGALARREYAEVDLSSLDILLRRHEYSSSFCLLHNCLTKEKEVTVSLPSSCDGKRARVTRPRALSKSNISRASGSGAATAVREISVCSGESSAHGPPGSSCSCRGIVQEPSLEQKLAEVHLSSLNILLSRHEQSSAFCFPHNGLTKEKQVTRQSTALVRWKFAEESSRSPRRREYAEVAVSSLLILLRRPQQSSGFCLLPNWL